MIIVSVRDENEDEHLYGDENKEEKSNGENKELLETLNGDNADNEKEEEEEEEEEQEEDEKDEDEDKLEEKNETNKWNGEDNKAYKNKKESTDDNDNENVDDLNNDKEDDEATEEDVKEISGNSNKPDAHVGSDEKGNTIKSKKDDLDVINEELDKEVFYHPDEPKNEEINTQRGNEKADEKLHKIDEETKKELINPIDSKIYLDNSDVEKRSELWDGKHILILLEHTLIYFFKVKWIMQIIVEA